MENLEHPIDNHERKKREIFLDQSREELSDVFSKHHIIGQKNRSWANIRLKENHIMVKQKRHNAFNTVFNENQDPQSQLLFILSKTKNVIEYNTYNQLFKILSKPKEYFYKDFLVKK